MPEQPLEAGRELEQRIAEAFRKWNIHANGGAVDLRYYPSTGEIWGKVEGLAWNVEPDGGKLMRRSGEEMIAYLGGRGAEVSKK